VETEHDCPDLVSAAEDPRALHELNAWLADAGAGACRLALSSLPGEHALSSSFGAQSAAILHLVSRKSPDYSGDPDRHGICFRRRIALPIR